MGALWHPKAIRRVHLDAGGFEGGGRKIVWHTTEGAGLLKIGLSLADAARTLANGRRR